MKAIQVPTDWQSIVESDPKQVAANIDRLRGALEMCERHFKRNKYPKTHPARRIIAAALL